MLKYTKSDTKFGLGSISIHLSQLHALCASGFALPACTEYGHCAPRFTDKITKKLMLDNCVALAQWLAMSEYFYLPNYCWFDSVGRNLFNLFNIRQKVRFLLSSANGLQRKIFRRKIRSVNHQFGEKSAEKNPSENGHSANHPTISDTTMAPL